MCVFLKKYTYKWIYKYMHEYIKIWQKTNKFWYCWRYYYYVATSSSACSGWHIDVLQNQIIQWHISWHSTIHIILYIIYVYVRNRYWISIVERIVKNSCWTVSNRLVPVFVHGIFFSFPQYSAHSRADRGNLGTYCWDIPFLLRHFRSAELNALPCCRTNESIIYLISIRFLHVTNVTFLIKIKCVLE